MTPIGPRRIAASRQYMDVRKILPFPLKQILQFFERAEEVALNIVVQGPEWGNINDTGQSGAPLSRNQLIQCPEKGGECFTASGGSRDEQMLSRGDFGPGLLLNIGGLTDSFLKPSINEGMEESTENLYPPASMTTR